MTSVPRPDPDRAGRVLPASVARAEDRAALRVMRAAAGGRLLALRAAIVLALLMAAQAYDGSLHALSHWTILALYAAGSLWFGLAERGEGARAETFAWAGTLLNAGLALYVILEHMLAGGLDGNAGADAASRLPAFLLLLQTGLTMRVAHAALFSGLVATLWTLAVGAAVLHPDGLGPHVDLTAQIVGLLTFAAASYVVIDGVVRLRRAVGRGLRLERQGARLARFVPGPVAVDLARTGGTADGQGLARRHACLLMLDIRGFSALSRAHPPEVMVRALLAVRALAQEAVTAQGGIVDKYVGDAVLAQFVLGEPGAQAHAALEAARALRDGMDRLNRQRVTEGAFPLRVVVALHAGEVLVGVFDDGVRAEYTVLGPAMNALARIEVRAKAAEIALAASEDFLRLVGLPMPDGFDAVPADEPETARPQLFAVREAGAPAPRRDRPVRAEAGIGLGAEYPSGSRR